MNTLLRRPISIFAQQNPNPNSMKFVLNVELAPDRVGAEGQPIRAANRAPSGLVDP